MENPKMKFTYICSGAGKKSRGKHTLKSREEAIAEVDDIKSDRNFKIDSIVYYLDGRIIAKGIYFKTKFIICAEPYKK